MRLSWKAYSYVMFFVGRILPAIAAIAIAAAITADVTNWLSTRGYGD
ncbi:hypothetical protein DYI24_00795 [Rhodopseudomonas sp. BR0C11]|nr:hypothetical protein [Rhodopseudomonas sp. BR0C11]NEV75615.1 hypothetical protein [Rhodopseudomonas sp. BR0C11]